MNGFKFAPIVAAGAVLALPVAAVAPAQPSRGAVSPPIGAETGTSPLVKRLDEFLDVVNSGDTAKMRAFVQANGMQPALLLSMLDLHRRSRGLDLVRVAMVDDDDQNRDGVFAIVRNRLTGDEQALWLMMEPQAPDRIVAVPPMLPGVESMIVETPVVPRSESARFQRIGSYLKRLGDADIFSGVVVIARDGKPVFSQAYGYADREKKIANTVDTPFNLASVTKLFTGLAIGRLVEQGKLSYEDPLSKFVPDFPDAESAKRIKIKHLLSHTSGLGNWGVPGSSLVDVQSVRGVLEKTAKAPPAFEPGTRFAYSNLGYQLLGRIVEIVSGEDYFDHIRKNVFVPAGMTSTFFPHFDRNTVTTAHAYELQLKGDSLSPVKITPAMPTARGGPAGGSIGSAPDLLRLIAALHAGRVVKPATYRLHATAKPELGARDYGYGFFTVFSDTNRSLVGHSGTFPGVCAEYGDFAGTPYTIVVLSNLTQNTCVSVTGKILQVLAPAQAPAD